MKKRYYILARITGFFLVVILTTLFLVQVPSVQTQLARAAVGMLSEKLDADISVGSLNFVPGNGLLISDIAIIDKNPYTEDRYGKGIEPSDSFFVASSIKARFTLKGLLSGNPLRLKSIQVDNGQMCLVSEPDREPYDNNLQRIFGTPAPEEAVPAGPEDIFHIKDVQVNNFRFRLKNYLDLPIPPRPNDYGFDWQDLEVFTNVTAHNLHFTDGKMYGDCEKCEIWRRDGYRVDEVRGKAAVGRGLAMIRNVEIIDEWSHLNLEYFSMSYSNGLAFSSFVDSVSLGGLFKPSELSLKTLKNFVGIFPESSNTLCIKSGQVWGPVSNMRIEGLEFTDKSSRLRASLGLASLKGLPDIDNFHIKASDTRIDVRSENVSEFLKDFAPKASVKLPADIDISTSIEAEGYLNDFVADVKFATNIGNVLANVNVVGLLRRDPEIKGALEAREITVGGLAEIENLGRLSLNGGFDAVLGESPSIRLDSLEISELEYMGYSYRSISGSGEMDGDKLEARLSSNEANLNFDVRAHSTGDGYEINAKIKKADLRALGLEAMTGFSAVRGNLKGNIDAFDKDRKKGVIALKNMHFEKGADFTRDIDAMAISVDKDSIGLALGLDSKLLQGEFYGKSVEDFKLSARLHDKDRILNFFIPGLYAADNSNIEATRTPGNKIELAVTSPLLGFKKNYIKNIDVNLNYNDGKADFKITAPEIGIGKTIISDTDIHLAGDYLTTERDVTLKTNEQGSYISINGQKWTIPASTIYIGETGIRLGDFSLNGDGSERIYADGGLSKNSSDTLLVFLENIDFSLLDAVTAQKYGIKGKMNGIASIESTADKGVKLDAAVTAAGLTLNGEDAGNFELAAMIDGPQIIAGINNSFNGNTTLNALAEVNTSDRKIDVGINLDGFKLDILQPILNDIFSETSGRIDGTVSAKGSFDTLSVQSDSLMFNDAMLRVKLTNVPYTLNGAFGITNEGIELSGIKVSDDENGSGFINGKLNFNSFDNPTLDAKFKFNGLKLLGKPNDTGDGFYGTAYADGDVILSGRQGIIDIDVNAITAKNGSVHVPVGSALASESKILTFREPEDFQDEYLLSIMEKSEEKQEPSSGLNLKAKVRIQDNTEAVVEIDKSQGHLLSVKGQGDVSVIVQPGKDGIELGGIYNINSGRYHFAALSNIATKDFTIQNGSSIKFNGNPAESQFDITALYTKKASIEPLIASNKSQGGLRTVECGLHIGEKISNPDLRFSIDIPDLDPGTKSQVESALNTDDKIQKQFVALVLTGSFIPTEESGVTFNGGNAVFSNLSSIMSGQLNNILQSLNIPVDMGLNYQKSNSGKDIFDVAVSTQLFNNRVILNGSVGNRTNTTSPSGVVGDVDVEVKLNKSGSLRLKLFSHSPDSYTNYLDNAQRNGLGLSFQSEFTYWKTLWRSIVGSKEERQKIRLGKMERKPLKTIEIDE